MQPLRYGAEGAAVADVRRVLAGLGLLANLDPSTERTFDTSAELAVRHFQQRRGLSVDGVVGPETFAALNSARETCSSDSRRSTSARAITSAANKW